MRSIDVTYGLEQAIGNTPLVPLRRLVPNGSAEVWVKLEGLNPGGSVKDRVALEIVRSALHRGQLGQGRVLLDASSGNTGIAYAMICASRGLACEICISAQASEACKELLRAYGARVVETPREDGSDGAIVEARQRAAERPDHYFYADQYNNSGNVRAHYETTGPEIWRQTDGRVTHLVAGLGTSGTLMGTGKRLREFHHSIRITAVQPDSPFHGIEGWKHMPTAIVPGLYDPTLPDEVLTIGTETAQDMARRLSAEEGLITGVSGGANVVAAVEVASALPSSDLVVTVLPDRGDRSLGEQWREGRP